ncbi:hypothetical protein SKAU_G00198200 [Synaphobranchus kaupii]|uniref:Uncharacterized protein n=1 Tax=Synaphobranchus kaupii TaxID=118154 RepID=A0A9Q1IXK6_SYNKA|nr:hypothetical protein SKAU_G00198200 [Synaphobranchus kaupii]
MANRWQAVGRAIRTGIEKRHRRMFYDTTAFPESSGGDRSPRRDRTRQSHLVNTLQRRRDPGSRTHRVGAPRLDLLQAAVSAPPAPPRNMNINEETCPKTGRRLPFVSIHKMRQIGMFFGQMSRNSDGHGCSREWFGGLCFLETPAARTHGLTRAWKR